MLFAGNALFILPGAGPESCWIISGWTLEVCWLFPGKLANETNAICISDMDLTQLKPLTFRIGGVHETISIYVRHWR